MSDPSLIENRQVEMRENLVDKETELYNTISKGYRTSISPSPPTMRCRESGLCGISFGYGVTPGRIMRIRMFAIVVLLYKNTDSHGTFAPRLHRDNI